MTFPSSVLLKNTFFEMFSISMILDIPYFWIFQSSFEFQIFALFFNLLPSNFQSCTGSKNKSTSYLFCSFLTYLVGSFSINSPLTSFFSTRYSRLCFKKRLLSALIFGLFSSAACSNLSATSNLVLP